MRIRLRALDRKAKAEIKQLVTDLRATGGTKNQLDWIAGLAEKESIDDAARDYINGRLLPLARACYYTCIDTRGGVYRLNSFQFVIPAIASVLSFSASGLFKNVGDLISFGVGVLTGLLAVSIAFEKLDQPALEWSSARHVYATICRELSLWNSGLNGYERLGKGDRLQLLKSRVESVMLSSEVGIMNQIRGSIESDQSGDLLGDGEDK
jgi:hypothetical protein